MLTPYAAVFAIRCFSLRYYAAVLPLRDFRHVYAIDGMPLRYCRFDGRHAIAD